GVLAGGLNSVALCNDSGAEVVGGWSLLSDVKQHGMVWRESTGMLDVNALVTGTGADLTGWSLTEVRGISGDGTVVAGSAIHNDVEEAWISSIPVGGGCGSADFD